MDNTTKKAVAYSLLAHVKTSGILADGPVDIFIPLVKKGLHFMNTNKGQYKGETISEIKNIIEENYGIDIPIPVLRSILKKIASEVNKEEKIFELYQDDSFWIKNYVFEDFDEHIEKSKKEIHVLQDMFKKFCQINNVDYNENSCIIKFIEKNKVSISSYLANTKRINGNDFTTAALFVDYFRNFPQIYSQIKNLYLGSMLTCYLDFEPTDTKMDVTLLLDTNFIVSLLDLNTEESTHTCNKLLEICHKIGYKFRVLKDTIEETRALLAFKAKNYDKDIITKYINREDIYNACERRNLNGVDLDRISDNLENTLLEKNVIVIPHTDKLKNKARLSNDYEVLKKYRNTDKAALHDAMAITYVKDTRGKRIKQFENINCWFVNNAISHDIDNEGIDALLNTKENEFQPEEIKADDLLNILWLSKPNVDMELANNDLVDMGLTSLIAFTLNESLPKARIIRELDDNIQKYKKTDFSDRDVLLLATRIANRQVQNIEGLNDLAKNDSNKFADRIKEEARKQDAVEKERAEKFDKLFEELKDKIQGLDERRKRVEENLTAKKEEEIGQVAAKSKILLSEKDKEIERLKLKNLNAENRRREEQRDDYINRKVKVWKRNSFIWLCICILAFIIALLWLFAECDYDFGKMDNKIKVLSQNAIIAGLLSLFMLIINSFVIKCFYDRFFNHSNIENYKKSIQIPNEYKPLREE